jgi:hypothetical protein
MQRGYHGIHNQQCFLFELKDYLSGYATPHMRIEKPTKYEDIQPDLMEYICITHTTHTHT